MPFLYATHHLRGAAVAADTLHAWVNFQYEGRVCLTMESKCSKWGGLVSESKSHIVSIENTVHTGYTWSPLTYTTDYTRSR
jgi:hypothetical protein